MVVKLIKRNEHILNKQVLHLAIVQSSEFRLEMKGVHFAKTAHRFNLKVEKNDAIKFPSSSLSHRNIPSQLESKQGGYPLVGDFTSKYHPTTRQQMAVSYDKFMRPKRTEKPRWSHTQLGIYIGKKRNEMNEQYTSET